MTTGEDGAGQIDIYPVGVLSDWHRRTPFRYAARRYLESLRARQWRNLRNSFNGYLAEVSFGNLPHTHCGHGWTRRRAARSLGEYLARDSGAL